MADLSGFDASDAEHRKGFEPLPVGDYTVFIVASAVKPTRSGAGSYLRIEMEVAEGAHAGRRLWDRLNLTNPNPAAVRFGKARLAAICLAVGVARPSDSSDLHRKPMIASVDIKRREDNSELTNEVKGYAPAAAGAVAPAGWDWTQEARSPWRR